MRECLLQTSNKPTHSPGTRRCAQVASHCRYGMQLPGGQYSCARQGWRRGRGGMACLHLGEVMGVVGVNRQVLPERGPHEVDRCVQQEHEENPPCDAVYF